MVMFPSCPILFNEQERNGKWSAAEINYAWATCTCRCLRCPRKLKLLSLVSLHRTGFRSDRSLVAIVVYQYYSKITPSQYSQSLESCNKNPNYSNLHVYIIVLTIKWHIF